MQFGCFCSACNGPPKGSCRAGPVCRRPWVLEAFGKAREDPDGGGWLPASYSKHKIEDYTTNLILGRLDYGVTRDLDVFLCLGFSDAQDDMSEERATGSQGNEYSGLDCDFGFAWGLGTRATFLQEGDVTWGGLLQVIRPESAHR
ncbi:MAG: hypothetical protein ACYS74_21995 [Planctomycetota bacterium]|jgi:hypothetical protein